MLSDQKPKKILAVEPVGFRGHRNFNTYLLRILQSIGNVTLVAPFGYLDSDNVNTRVNIPIKLCHNKTKIGSRWSQIRVLNYIIKNINLDNFDTIIFLAYETISFSLMWPKSNKVFLFEHNNIENIGNSVIKSYFYKHLSNKAIHLTFQSHITKYIHDNFKKNAIHIPHPHYRTDVSESGELIEDKILCSTDNKIIFSPSASTSKALQYELMKFAKENINTYYVICKGEPEEKTSNYEVRSFFNNYEDLMRTSDIVFLGARLNNRVSGVAYEALSYGRPLITFDCPFGRALKEKYTSLIYLFSDINNLQSTIKSIKKNSLKQEHMKFMKEHSYNKIRAEILNAIHS